ncbi:MAG: hypothetical protein RIR26_2574 [Pseudomonadota bacterium]
MKTAVLIVGDPLEKLRFDSDSSLALAEGALELGLQVHWTTPANLDLLNGALVVQNPAEIRMVGNDLTSSEVKILDKTSIPASSYQKVLIRKDPPFDESYVDLCWFMSQIPVDRVVNRSEALLLHHEKLTPWTLAKAGVIPAHSVVPTLVSKRIASLIQFAEEQFSTASSFLETLKSVPEFESFHFKLISKPWRGHGGREIHSFDSLETLKQWLSNLPTGLDPQELMKSVILQPFLPEIFTLGDRRVFIVDGDVVFDFVRFPAEGKIAANLAQGGSAQLLPLSDEVQEMASRIGKFLLKLGIKIAGLDFIGDRLMEVNITSPTGIRTFEALSGQRISTQLMAKILGF